MNLFVALFLILVNGQPFGTVKMDERYDLATCQAVIADPDAHAAAIDIATPYANGQPVEVAAAKCAPADQ